eukprot:273589-Lingulodinium_polyedra.AAC.1
MQQSQMTPQSNAEDLHGCWGQRAPRARAQVLSTFLPAPRPPQSSAPEVRDAHLDAKDMLLPWMLTPLVAP